MKEAKKINYVASGIRIDFYKIREEARIMRKIAYIFYWSILLFMLVLAGCNNSNTKTFDGTLAYSNLLDSSVQEQLADIMRTAGISELRQQVFFDHVNQFNRTVSTEGMAAGFEEKNILEAGYDSYAMQEEWEAQYPDFLGYNCRITAYGLFADYMTIATDGEMRDDIISMDLMSLEEDSSIFQDEKDENRFRTFYATIPTEETKDIAVHVKNLRSDWEARGISFDGNEKVRLISVIFHDVWDEQNNLFIGHIGLLFPTSENEMYFLEKIAFQEPYQLTRFHSRAELKDYLMIKYAIDENQSTATPFIMENDKLMEE